jgi:mono/diheme cytochrome c family protein
LEGRLMKGNGMRWSLGALLLAVVVAVMWPFGASQSQLFGLGDYSGEEVYLRFCASCHGMDGQGGGPVAASLNVVVPDLTRLAARNDGVFPAADVREIVDGRAVVVAHGPRSMPVWGYEFWFDEGGDITAEAEARAAINRLVSYLSELQAEVPDPAMPR